MPASEEEEEEARMRKLVHDLTWNYLRDTVERCGQEDDRANPRQQKKRRRLANFNVFRDMTNKQKSPKSGVGIVIDRKRLKRRAIVVPGGDSSSKGSGAAIGYTKASWEVRLGSFKSCCIHSVIVDPHSMRDFVKSGAVVLYESSVPTGSANTKLKGHSFQFLDDLKPREEGGREAQEELSALDVLRAWSVPYFHTKLTYICSIRTLSPVELALIKARIVTVSRLEVTVRSDESGCAPNKAAGGSGTGKESLDVFVSFGVDDCTGRAACHVEGDQALRMLTTLNPTGASALIAAWKRVSAYYNRTECKLSFALEKGKRTLKMPDFVEMSYPNFKKTLKTVLGLCSSLGSSEALNFLCQHAPGPDPPSGSGTFGGESGTVSLSVLHWERTSSLYESLKHQVM